MRTRTYIINLRRYEERRKSILERLGAFPDIALEFVDAVDASSMAEADLQKYASPMRKIYRNCLEHSLTNGDIACALTHRLCAGMIDTGVSECWLTLANKRW